MSSPDGNSAKVNTTTIATIGQGAEATVNLITITDGDGVSRTYAQKRFSPEALSRAQTQKIDIKVTYSLLSDAAKKAGLPVMEDCQIEYQDGQAVGILMPDLSENREKFVFSSGDLQIQAPQEENVGNWNNYVDDPFGLSLTPEEQAWLSTLMACDFSPNSPRLAEMYNYAQQAANAGILIDHPDSIMYVVPQQGELKIFYPGELSSMHAAVIDENGHRTEVAGLTANTNVSVNLPLDQLISENLNAILRSFAKVYRYQEIKNGHVPPTNISYINSARRNFGLKPVIG